MIVQNIVKVNSNDTKTNDKKTASRQQTHVNDAFIGNLFQANVPFPIFTVSTFSGSMEMDIGLTWVNSK